MKKQCYWYYYVGFFFLIAALAMEPPAHFPVLCKKALRVALSLHKKQPQTDLTRCRQTHHFSPWKHPWHFINYQLPQSKIWMKGFLIVHIFFSLCFSKCIHSLIKLSLPTGVSEVEAHGLEEVWSYYEEAMSILATTVSQSPTHTSIPQLLPSHFLQQRCCLLHN